jgi:hypothetical protein
MLTGRCPEKRKAPAVSGAPFVSTRKAGPIEIYIHAPRFLQKRKRAMRYFVAMY